LAVRPLNTGWCSLAGVLWLVFSGWCSLAGVLWLVFSGWCSLAGVVLLKSKLARVTWGAPSRSKNRKQNINYLFSKVLEIKTERQN
jgi:hypothetical protein